MILSHHGEPEFGAAVRPICAESELLSQIDMLDSRMEIYRETLAGLQVGEVVVTQNIKLHANYVLIKLTHANPLPEMLPMMIRR